MSHTQDASASFGTERIQMLADGIFAIAMTLLVLDLKDQVAVAGDIWYQFQLLAPKLFAYTISFLILGLYWTGHHAEFHYITRTNRLHLWLNILILMVIALVPFSAALLAEQGSRPFAVLIYCCNLMLISLAFFVHWSYATTNHRLVDDALDPRVIRDVKQRLLSSTILLVAAIAISLWHPLLSFVIYALIQLIYIIKTTRTTTGVPIEMEE